MEIKGKIKKGSVAIYVLALMLVTAGYWNYISNESQSLETVSISENDNQNTVDENLGDATLVSNSELIQEEDKKEEKSTEESEEDEYFQESKLSRDKMYSQTLETYQNMLDNSNVSEEQKTIATQEITKLNKEKNAIMICENLISTKGFENCVIFVNVDSISVIVKSDKLQTDEIAQIQNIISREMGADISNIHIMTK
jgi:stage III sporulation protein AH